VADIADVLLITGLVMVVCSPGFMVCLVWSAWRRHRKITSTIPLLTCEQINRAEHLPRRVAVAGRTTSGGHDGDVRWQEVIIRPDVPVFVVGRPSRSGQLGPLMTIIKEKGPWRLPELGFPMPTGHRPLPSQDGIALDSVWFSPCGVAALPAAEVRRRYAVRLTRTIAWLFILPALGLALIALATFV
jgi:hypothetical protein